MITQEQAQAKTARVRSKAHKLHCRFFFPRAKLHDSNDRVIVEHQYNQCLQPHSILKQSGKIKDYGMTWVQAVKTMQSKVNKS